MATPLEQYIAQLQGGSLNDSQLNAAIRTALLKSADQLAQRRVAEEILQGDYEAQRFDLETSLDRALSNLTNDFSGRGTFRSSVYAGEQGRTATDYQTALTEAARKRTQTLSQIAQAAQTGQTDLLSMLYGEQAGATQRDAQARHQKQLEERQAQHQQELLNLQRQQQADQSSYLNQQIQMQQRAQAQQQSYYQQMINQMQPTTSPTGSVSYLDAARLRLGYGS